MAVKGIFLIKEQEIAQERITQIGNKYLGKCGVNFRQNIALLRTICCEIISMMEDCFIMDMAAATRYRDKLKYCAQIDNPTMYDVSEVYRILGEFYNMASHAILIKDLPSCKKLTELSPEDAVAAAKDLIKSDIVKSGIAIMLLGMKVGDALEISRVRTFYKEALKVLLSDIDEVHRPATAIEKSLIIKFNAEIGYCNMAMYKTGFGITKEIIDLIDKSKQDIQIYEEQVAYDISTRPILMK